MTRCFLSESNLKDKFWVRAANTACYIRNRCLTKSNNSDKTPYEQFFDKKPTVYHLRRFGCLVYTKTLSNRRKLDPKAEKMIFGGYERESKNYILYSMKKQFICSRNVKFDKKQFYYSVSKDSSRSFAFQPVVNNQNTETPTVNSQDGTNEPGIVPSTANVDDLTETESTQSLLLPSLTDNENLVNQATSPEKRAIKTPERLGNPIQFPDKQKITDFTFSSQCHSEKKNPLTRSEAMNSMNCESWKQTINSELDSLQKLGVYDLVDKQKDFPLIKGKWIFVTQRLPDGSISKHKARYVAKGYSQVYGENYTETFSPTVSHSTIRVLLALAAKNSMKIHQIEVKTAFLNSPIKDNIYLEQPPGSIQEGYEDKV